MEKDISYFFITLYWFVSFFLGIFFNLEVTLNIYMCIHLHVCNVCVETKGLTLDVGPKDPTMFL